MAAGRHRSSPPQQCLQTENRGQKDDIRIKPNCGRSNLVLKRGNEKAGGIFPLQSSLNFEFAFLPESGFIKCNKLGSLKTKNSNNIKNSKNQAGDHTITANHLEFAMQGGRATTLTLLIKITTFFLCRSKTTTNQNKKKGLLSTNHTEFV